MLLKVSHTCVKVAELYACPVAGIVEFPMYVCSVSLNSSVYVRWWYAVPCPEKGDLPLVVSAMDIMPSIYGPQVDDQWVRNFQVTFPCWRGECRSGFVPPKIINI